MTWLLIRKPTERNGIELHRIQNSLRTPGFGTSSTAIIILQYKVVAVVVVILVFGEDKFNSIQFNSSP